MLVEKEAELKKAGKLPEFTTIESRFDLMESSAREYFETNSSLSARETEQVLEKSREFLTSLARRNNKLLEKKISQLKSNSGNAVDPEEGPVITGEEFIHNILAVKLEMGMMNARVYHAVVELMSLQQTSGEPLPTAYFQEYAEKEILSRDWTEEEMQ
ncbi:MAG TPA: hypothetical protein VKA68_07785 [bacterium]|nr:hypothetical protein [bacterium]